MYLYLNLSSKQIVNVFFCMCIKSYQRRPFTLLQVEGDLDRVRNATSQQELMSSFKDLGESLVDLAQRAAQRQNVRRLPNHKTLQLCTR